MGWEQWALGGAAAGAGIIGSVIASKAAGKAADTQAKSATDAAWLQKQAADDALAFQKQQYEESKTMLQPYLQAGYGGLNALLYGMGMPQQKTPDITAPAVTTPATTAPQAPNLLATTPQPAGGDGSTLKNVLGTAAGIGSSVAGSAAGGILGTSLAGIPIVGPVAAGLAAGIPALVNKIQGPNSYEAAAKEISRDFGGVQLSPEQVKAMFDYMGVSEADAWKNRAQLLRTPLAYAQYIEAAKQQGKLDSLLAASDKDGSMWGMPMSGAIQSAINGDPSALNSSYSQLMVKNAQTGEGGAFAGLENIVPQWEKTALLPTATPTTPGTSGTPTLPNALGKVSTYPTENVLTKGISTTTTPDASNIAGLSEGEFLKEFSLEEFEKDPGVAFRLAEGTKALERKQAQMGGLLGGAAVKQAIRYNQDYNSNEYANAFNRFKINQSDKWNKFASLSGGGQTTAQQLNQSGTNYANNASNLATGTGNALADLTTQAGNARASGYASQGNIWGTGINNMLQNIIDVYAQSKKSTVGT